MTDFWSMLLDPFYKIYSTGTITDNLVQFTILHVCVLGFLGMVISTLMNRR